MPGSEHHPSLTASCTERSQPQPRLQEEDAGSAGTAKRAVSLTVFAPTASACWLRLAPLAKAAPDI